VHQARRRPGERRLYRDLSTVRSEFQRALTEPPPVGARAQAWWPVVIAVERIVDATTATRVRVEHGAPVPTPAEVAAVARELADLAEALRTGEPLPEAEPDLLAPDCALARLHHEVHAARAVAAPVR
ncbi:FUSC family protein, partial [Kitasatospora sp. NPDC004799]